MRELASSTWQPAWTWRGLRVVAGDIKLAHSVFALPFALLAMFLAAASGSGGGRLPHWAEVGLIVLCMVLARTYAMTVNRWADAGLDAANPRTAGRAIPSGRVSRAFVGAVVIVSAAGLILAAAGFWLVFDNPWPVLCSPLVLGVLGGYSLTKRVTWASHLILGLSLGLAVPAAALAIEPGSLVTAPPSAYLLGAAVLCWVAGFDVIYALQDVAIDRAQGLFSMPARLGVEPALWVSRTLHLGVVGLLIVLSELSRQLHLGFLLSVIGVAGLLLLEHALIWRSRTNHIDLAFFTLNGIISLLLGAAGIVDVWRVVGHH